MLERKRETVVVEWRSKRCPYLRWLLLHSFSSFHLNMRERVGVVVAAATAAVIVVAVVALVIIIIGVVILRVLACVIFSIVTSSTNLSSNSLISCPCISLIDSHRHLVSIMCTGVLVAVAVVVRVCES